MRCRVKVSAGARRESLAEGKGGVLGISVREKAERGAANLRVRELVARHFGVSVKAVRIVKGHRGSSKTLEVLQ
ncbi:MAG: DUF167 domain-containing protein [Patescibacteria group bacterium]|nr:DUF167 domain-containing protein [bacterium]MDZ4227328.1 DUF167 domain-containing protein [Patescibacteria group bacterium]